MSDPERISSPRVHSGRQPISPKPCRRCGREFVARAKYKWVCLDCEAFRRKWVCQGCGGPRERRAQRCFMCRWAPFRGSRVCPDCGGRKTPQALRCNTCSGKVHRGSASSAWKGGRYLNDSGYAMFWAPTHTRANNNGYVREHIKIWEEIHGSLAPGFQVHHLNGIRTDNRIENLAAVHRSEHESWTLTRLLRARIRELEQELERRDAHSRIERTA